MKRNSQLFTVLIFLLVLSSLLALISCREQSSDEINVITREEGSGTRSAFSELFGLIAEDASGKKTDLTLDDAEVTSKTAELLISVSLNKNAIGYTSLGTLGESVKALAINNTAPSTENIKRGKYPAVRRFFAITRGEINAVAEDFLSYILSSEGARIISAGGYIAEGGGEYTPKVNEGTLRISGSSSVYPIIEKLGEAYAERNPDVRIELQQSDSSSGIRDVIGGTSDIGLSSREPSAEEIQSGIKKITIALDGIAVVVHPENPITSLTPEQIRAIFSGEIKSWSEVQK